MSILPPRVQPPSPAGPFWLCTLPPIYKHNQSRRLTQSEAQKLFDADKRV